MSVKLGIIAGGGELPALAIRTCQDSGRDFFVLALKGQADHPLINEVPHLWVHLGATSKAQKAANSEGVEELVFAGHVRRPSLTELRLDAKSTAIMMRAGARALGDDGLLTIIADEAMKMGFKLVGVHTVVPDILAPEGILGSRSPDKQAKTDIQRGLEVARALGAVDVGQSVIVQTGIVLGVEGIEGTDNLMRRCGELHRRGNGGVLVKTVKPTQDWRFDLPTIGQRTISVAKESGLSGIAIQAGGTIILQREDVVRAADRAKIFVIGCSVE